MVLDRLVQSRRREPVRFGVDNFKLRDLPFRATSLAAMANVSEWGALLAEKIAPSANDDLERGKVRDERGVLGSNSKMVSIKLGVM